MIDRSGTGGQFRGELAVGHARCVGRVGALAVALGVGMAVATTPGFAWADETSTTSTVDKDTVDKDTVDETSRNPTTGGTPDAHEAPESHLGTAKDVDTKTGAGTGATGTGSGASIGVREGPRVILDVRPVGTVQPSTITSPPVPPVNPLIVNPAQSLTPQPAPLPVVDPVVTTPTTPVSKAQPVGDPAVTTPNNPVSGAKGPKLNNVGTSNISPASADLPKTTVSPRPNALTVLPSGAVGNHQSTMRTSATLTVTDPDTSNLLQRNTSHTVATPALPVPTVPPPTPFDTVIALPGTVISAALNLITKALSPVFGPGAPADNPVLWGILAFVRRQFNETFANSTPALAPQQTSQDLDDGQVHGTFGGTDADGDTLAYTVPTTGLGASTHGTVVVDQASGTYTYTPDAGYTGADYFFVTATDDTASPHIHALGQTHLAGARVDVTVSAPNPAPNRAPVITGIVTTYDPDGGAVTVAVSSSDPDGDPVSYTLGVGGAPVAVNADGTLALNATTTSASSVLVTATDPAGKFFSAGVVLPTAISTTTGGRTLVAVSSVVVPLSAADGSGALTAVSQTVNPAGGFVTTYALPAGNTLANDALTVTFVMSGGPTQTTTIATSLRALPPTAGPPTVGAPDTGTGTVTGTLNFNDPAGLELTYTTTGDPSLGAVTITDGGGFSYTPTVSARNDAAAGGPVTDAFTVKAVNSAGASAVVTVTVPVSPTPVVVNHAPVAPTTQGPVTYDSDTGIATGALGFTDPDGDPLTYAVTTTPTYGTVSVNANGTYTFTPTADGRALAATTPGLADTFSVTASDGQLSTPSLLRVNVEPVVARGPVSIHVGINPEQVVVTPDGSTVYVTNNGRYVSSGQPRVGDSVSVISTATNTVIKTIQVGDHPSGLAITPNGSTVYVTNFDDDTVSVISTATNTVVATIAVGGNPRRVLVTADGSRALVVNANIDVNAEGSLSVVDTATNTVISTIGLVDNVTRFSPSSVVANTDGSVIYVTNGQGSYTDVIVGGTVERLLYTGGAYPSQSAPASAVLDDNTLYVADDYSSQVTVVDLLGNDGRGAIVKRIDLPVQPAQIVRSPDGMSLYVGGGNAVVKVDIATGAVTNVATIADASIQGITLSPDGTVLYATNPGAANESDDALLVVPLS